MSLRIGEEVLDNLPSSLLLPHFSPQSFPKMGEAMEEAAMEAAMARENFIVAGWCWVGGKREVLLLLVK